MSHSRLLPLALIALLAGCGSTVSMQPPGVRATDYSPTDRIRVMLAPWNLATEASSRAISARIIEVLQQTHADVALVPSSDLQEALATARKERAVFLVSPTILEWTDSHAPPLTADRVKLRIDLLDPNAGDVVSSMTFENASSLLSVTDDRPDVLLDRSFDRAVTLLITTGSTGRSLVRQPVPTNLENVPVDQQKYPRQ